VRNLVALPAGLRFNLAWYWSNCSSARSYVCHLIHFGFGARSHSAGSNPPISHSRLLIRALPKWHRWIQPKH
jgi:hypothetical protein